jgi:hypothetical protein
MQNLTILVLGLALIGLSACTTTAESQLKASVCRDCLGKKEFYRNGVWIEEASRG